MTSMVLGELILESLTPSVNASLVLILSPKNVRFVLKDLDLVLALDICNNWE
jgi:hypothetical protein